MEWLPRDADCARPRSHASYARRRRGARGCRSRATARNGPGISIAMRIRVRQHSAYHQGIFPPSVNFGLLASTMPNCLVAVIDAITLPFASTIATVSPALPLTFAVLRNG